MHEDGSAILLGGWRRTRHMGLYKQAWPYVVEDKQLACAKRSAFLALFRPPKAASIIVVSVMHHRPREG